MQDITRTLSRYICSSHFDALPSEVKHEGVRAFVNWIGCAAGGSRDDMVERVLEVVMEFNGAAAATVIGRRERLDLLNATFINSLSSGVLAFSDTHLATVAHPTSPVAAALLALSERQPISGKQFVHALILGIEIQCRVGNILCTPPAECQAGLSMAGLVGGVGAAVAAGKILALNEDGIAMAIGHAANEACGLRETYGTMASTLTQGHSARSGLLAAMLASRGVSCSDKMIEGPKGFAASYAQRPNLGAAVDKLGETFEILKIAYKPYPCGVVIHPIIDVCLNVRKSDALTAAQIDRVDLTVNPLTVKFSDHVDPAESRQALFSLQHWAATSLIYNTAGIAQVADSIVHEPAVRELRRKVVVTGLGTVGLEAASIRILLKDGRTVEASVSHCRGSLGHPLTDEDISEKTTSQLRTVYSADATNQILGECWRIENYPLVHPLCQLLSPIT